jgi:TusA-related sulfurtransferase
MKAKEKLEIHVTDKSAPNDFKDFCADMGHKFISENKISDNVISIIVSVGALKNNPL